MNGAYCMGEVVVDQCKRVEVGESMGVAMEMVAITVSDSVR